VTAFASSVRSDLIDLFTFTIDYEEWISYFGFQIVWLAFLHVYKCNVVCQISPLGYASVGMTTIEDCRSRQKSMLADIKGKLYGLLAMTLGGIK
jgi:hypothetical protein